MNLIFNNKFKIRKNSLKDKKDFPAFSQRNQIKSFSFFHLEQKKKCVKGMKIGFFSCAWNQDEKQEEENGKMYVSRDVLCIFCSTNTNTSLCHDLNSRFYIFWGIK